MAQEQEASETRFFFVWLTARASVTARKAESSPVRARRGLREWQSSQNKEGKERGLSFAVEGSLNEYYFCFSFFFIFPYLAGRKIQVLLKSIRFFPFCSTRSLPFSVVAAFFFSSSLLTFSDLLEATLRRHFFFLLKEERSTCFFKKKKRKRQTQPFLAFFFSNTFFCFYLFSTYSVLCYKKKIVVAVNRRSVTS